MKQTESRRCYRDWKASNSCEGQKSHLSHLQFWQVYSRKVISCMLSGFLKNVFNDARTSHGQPLSDVCLRITIEKSLSLFTLAEARVLLATLKHCKVWADLHDVVVTVATSKIADTQMTYYDVREGWQLGKYLFKGRGGGIQPLPLYVQGLKEQNDEIFSFLFSVINLYWICAFS